MEEISINVQIAGKIYAVKVFKSEEAEIREAANNLNKRLDVLRQTYSGVRDINDLLSMALLECARELLNLQKRLDYEHQSISSSLRAINADVANAL